MQRKEIEERILQRSQKNKILFSNISKNFLTIKGLSSISQNSSKNIRNLKEEIVRIEVEDTLLNFKILNISTMNTEGKIGLTLDSLFIVDWSDFSKN